MSNRNWIKGMRRRAARRGLGRGTGNIRALIESVDQERAREVAAMKRKSELPADAAMARLVSQDQKRKLKSRPVRRRA